MNHKNAIPKWNKIEAKRTASRRAEATWSCGLHSHSPTVLPLSFGIGDIIVRPGLPPLNFYVTGQWTVYRQFGRIAPQTGVNFGLIVAFPEFRKW